MRPRGFTLIEVMISVALLSLVVVSLMATQTASIRSAGIHQDYTLATDLARAQLAEAMAIPLAQLAPDGAQGDGPYSRYRWERTLHATPGEGLVRVRVTVYWGPDEDRRFVAETLVAETETIF